MAADAFAIEAGQQAFAMPAIGGDHSPEAKFHSSAVGRTQTAVSGGARSPIAPSADRPPLQRNPGSNSNAGSGKPRAPRPIVVAPRGWSPHIWVSLPNRMGIRTVFCTRAPTRHHERRSALDQRRALDQHRALDQRRSNIDEGRLGRPQGRLQHLAVSPCCPRPARARARGNTARAPSCCAGSRAPKQAPVEPGTCSLTR